MASWLAAVGQANIPAVMKQYQDVSREMQEAPRREEKYQWEKSKQAEWEKGAPARKAVEEVELAKAQKEKEQMEADDKPDNVNTYLDKMEFSGELKKEIMALGGMAQVFDPATGIGKAGKIRDWGIKFLMSPAGVEMTKRNAGVKWADYEIDKKRYDEGKASGKKTELELQPLRDKMEKSYKSAMGAGGFNIKILELYNKLQQHETDKKSMGQEAEQLFE